MIISPQRNFIFIHLYKCGGTSIERAYESVSLWDDLILGSTEFGEYAQNYYKARFDLHKHSFARQILNALGETRYLSMESFALVRNPFRIYESLYGWIEGIYIGISGKKNIENLKRQVREGNVDRPFAKWPAARAYANAQDFREFMQYFEVNGLPFEPHSKSLMLDDPKFGVKNVYKLEEIRSFWRHFADVVGQPMKKLHENRSSSRNFNWDASQIDYIGTVYADDIKRFCYAFD